MKKKRFTISMKIRIFVVTAVFIVSMSIGLISYYIGIDRIDNYIKRLREFIADKVSKDNKPFIVSVSVGTHLGIPVEADLSNSHEVFENYLRIADAAMYVEKRRHKENRV